MNPKDCPNCTRALPKAWQGNDCPFCGIVFAKLQRVANSPQQENTNNHEIYRPPEAQPVKTPTQDSPPLRYGEFTAETDHDAENGRLKTWWLEHRETIAFWTEDKSPYGYGVLLCLMIYWAIRYTISPTYSGIFDGINLGIHEMGHLLFGFAGTFIMIAGGTFLQLCAPFATTIYFHVRSEYFGSGFALTWLGANCYNVAIYVADASDQLLDLVTVGGGVPIHDWNYLLNAMGLLGNENILAWIIRAFGLLCLWSGVLYGGWLIKMIVLANRQQESVN